EAGGGDEITGTERYFELPAGLVENRPELSGIMAKGIVIEGNPVEDTLANGPKVYRFHAENGQRIQSAIDELGRASFIKSDLYDGKGRHIADAQTFVEKDIFRRGGHFLVVSKLENHKGTRFSLEVMDAYERGVVPSILRNPENEIPDRVRYNTELSMPVIADDKFEVIFDFKNGRKPTKPGQFHVYAQEGDPSTFAFSGPDVKLPEDNPENIIPVDIRDFDESSVAIGAKWPKGSYVAVSAPGYMLRFFTTKT
ncbi:MAG: hypothetical protein WD988_01990, partial [Candidatus Curtissbacteria bacterium]